MYGHRLRCIRHGETPPEPLETPGKPPPKTARLFFIDQWRRLNSFPVEEGKRRAKQAWKDFSPNDRQYWIDKHQQAKEQYRLQQMRNKQEQECQEEFLCKVFQLPAMQLARLFQKYGGTFLAQFPERSVVLQLLQEQEELMGDAMDAYDLLRTEGTFIHTPPPPQFPTPHLSPYTTPPPFGISPVPMYHHQQPQHAVYHASHAHHLSLSTDRYLVPAHAFHPAARSLSFSPITTHPAPRMMPPQVSFSPLPQESFDNNDDDDSLNDDELEYLVNDKENEVDVFVRHHTC